MNDKKPWYETIVLPALLRHSRQTYGVAMRRALVKAGYDDIPRNGLYIIGGMNLNAGGLPVGQLGKELGTSKQAVGQLVDTLVLRGYLQREPDLEDRRKLTVTLTERGRAAAGVQAGVRKEIDADLEKRVGPENLLRTRKTLAALIALGREMGADEEVEH